MEKIKVIREYPPVGKYRVRLIEDENGPGLDIREFIVADSFEGYTRRGVRLRSLEAVKLLSDVLAQALAAEEWAVKKGVESEG